MPGGDKKGLRLWMVIWMNMSILNTALACGAVLAFALGLGYFLVRAGRRSLSRRLLLLNGALLCSIFLLELLFGLNAEEPMKLSMLVINSIKGLKMTADYKSIMQPAAIFMAEYPDWLLYIFRSFVYTLAPITGFTLVYDVVAGFSPSLKLFLLRRRPVFVFSGLNERSLRLAEDIAARRPVDKALLVFAGCGPDSEKLRPAAKALGAVCLEGSLDRCEYFRKSRLCCLFVMQQDAQGLADGENLSLLQSLMKAENSVWPEKGGCSIFFFTNSADTVESVRAIKLDYRARRGAEKSAVLKIHVVRDYAQSCAKLMDREALWQAAEGLAPGEPLRILVLGFNSFSKEMVKTLFWCGQLLEHPLRLCLVSPEGGGFEHWLRRHKSELVESCTEGAACLSYNRAGDRAEPYAALAFVSEDMDSLDVGGFLSQARHYDCGSGEQFCLEDYSCFFVMGGEDGQNMDIAARLRRELSYRHTEGLAPKYIYTLIEDENLRCTAQLRYEARNDAAVKMRSFGSLSQRYSWDSISMDSAYLHSSAAAAEPHSLPGMEESRDDIYNEWSNAARAVHLNYKMFCAGCAARPGEDRAGAEAEYLARARADEQLYFSLTWLEHRRWNAFLRAEGFRAPARLHETLRDSSLEELKKLPEWRQRAYCYKNIPDRLHPCLVESSPKYADGPDFLDTVSRLRDHVDGKPLSDGGLSGLKMYDAPDWEKTAKELAGKV